MNEHFNKIICEATGASSFHQIEIIQSLWSGYGKIVRLGLVGSDHKTVVVKHVRFTAGGDHPRGWNTNLSHVRKMKSYEVESEWYAKWNSLCNNGCRIPKCFAVETFENEVLIVLEDLNESEFCETRVEVSQVGIEACLTWLANLANFCFTKDQLRVAAVDFQYVGGGCGMKDIAYFLGSCLSEKDCEKYVPVYLDFYFSRLNEALSSKGVDVNEIEKELRELFPYAWADFHRFLKGWSPSHWKINSYSEKVTWNVVESFLNS